MSPGHCSRCGSETYNDGTCGTCESLGEPLATEMFGPRRAASDAPERKPRKPKSTNSSPFWKLPRWLVVRSDVSANAKLVYCYLDRLTADADGFVRPRLKVIGAAVGLQRNAVHRAVGELVAVGLLEQPVRRYRHSSLYRLSRPNREQIRESAIEDEEDCEPKRP